MITTCDQKPLSFKWLCLLTIINFIMAQLFAKHRFLKNTYLWLLLTSKSFSEFDSMFCYHEVRRLKKGFSQLFFVWSVKWWVSLKLWNNHSRDWINNFIFNGEYLTLQLEHGATVTNTAKKDMKEYMGLADTTFKGRHNNRKRDFKHPKYRNCT